MHSHPSILDHKEADRSFQRNRTKSIVFLLILSAALAVSILISLGSGSFQMSAGQLLQGIFGLAEDNRVNLVVQNNRLPRICAALLAGAGLGLAGCALQAVLHNPLASASTLGVSQGAGFGAAFAIVVLGRFGAGDAGVPVFAFFGSIAVALLILGLSRFRQISPEGIVLSGVAISSMFTGATTLLQYFADEVELSSIVFWSFGNLGSASWGDLGQMALAMAVLLVYSLCHRWDYNALLSGEETAVSLGIPVKQLTLVSLLLCCLTSSVVVSHVGLISFIGLVAPHIVRLVVGNNHVYLLPGAALAGALLLLLGDLFARTVISPAILPIGAITSFLGGPLFLYLLFKGGKQK